jgi:hypothetical protein
MGVTNEEPLRGLIPADPSTAARKAGPSVGMTESGPPATLYVYWETCKAARFDLPQESAVAVREFRLRTDCRLLGGCVIALPKPPRRAMTRLTGRQSPFFPGPATRPPNPPRELCPGEVLGRLVRGRELACLASALLGPCRGLVHRAPCARPIFKTRLRLIQSARGRTGAHRLWLQASLRALPLKT